MGSRFFEGAGHAALYAKFRPSPPELLIEAVLNFLKEKISSSNWQCAVDVGCGSGQSTAVFAEHFTEVTGTDVSPAQIEQALKNNVCPNITYRVCEAEKLAVPSSSAQLIASSQACHWFDMPAFFAEVDRVLVPGGVVALFSYTLPHVIQHAKAEQLTACVNEVFDKTLAGCWGAEVQYFADNFTDERFRIPYPGSVRDESHSFTCRVPVAELIGLISSWSAYQVYVTRHGEQRGKEEVLQVTEDKMMMLLGAEGAASSDTFIDLRYTFILMMGRKPELEH